MNKRKEEYPLHVTQEYKIERFTFKKLFSEIISAFNVERGLIYTIKMMFLDPGGAVRSYLYEGRHRFFPPVRFLLISSAVSILFLLAVSESSFVQAFQSGFMDGAKLNEGDETTKKTLEIFNNVFENYFNLIIWMQIPVFGLFTYFLFRKSVYNYAEHLIVLTYITSVINLLSIVSYALMALSSSAGFLIFSLISSLIYNIYFFKEFFQRSWGNAIYKSLIVYTIGSIVYLGIVVVLVTLYMGFKLM